MNLIKKEKIDKGKIINFLNKYSLLFHVILACTLCLFIETVSRHSLILALIFVFDHTWVFLYNSTIIFASLLLVYMFKKRFFMRFLISGAWCFLGIVNGCVLLKRVTPFNYTDLKLVGDLFTMTSTYFNKFEELAIIVLVGVFLFITFLLWKKGPSFKGHIHRILSVAGFSLCLVAIPAVTDAAVDNNILADYFENINQGYLNYGFVYGFTSSVVDIGMSEPDNYSAETISDIEDNLSISDTTLKDDEKPNVIVVLLESFIDPTQVDYLSLSKDPIPNFRYLEENYSSGYLKVPVVGAGTANTEFEILTGMSMQYFGLGEYPYKTILKTNSCESIASDLSDIGYSTHVVHNNGGNFYSRANAFSQMGFDTFTSKELMNIQEYTPLGSWPTDNILISEVKKAMDSTPKQQDLVYTITVQGHGSYPTEKVIDNPNIKVSGADSEETNNEWEYYVNEINEVDKFIGNLIDSVSKRDEKTMIVFFGDHLPTMELEDSDMASGNIFNTQYVTWNNFGLEKEDNNLTSFQLLAEMTDQIGIHEGTIFRYHQNELDNENKASDTSSSDNNNISDLTPDEIIEKTDKSSDYMKGLEQLQYDILYGKRYTYNGEDLYPASSLLMGVEDVVIDSLVEDTYNNELIISGSNFTKWSHVYVNGEKCDTNFVNGQRLRISLDDISNGSTIVVNQLGSKETIFRSSNEAVFTSSHSDDYSDISE